MQAPPPQRKTERRHGVITKRKGGKNMDKEERDGIEAHDIEHSSSELPAAARSEDEEKRSHRGQEGASQRVVRLLRQLREPYRGGAHTPGMLSQSMRPVIGV